MWWLGAGSVIGVMGAGLVDGVTWATATSEATHTMGIAPPTGSTSAAAGGAISPPGTAVADSMAILDSTGAVAVMAAVAIMAAVVVTRKR